MDTTQTHGAPTASPTTLTTTAILIETAFVGFSLARKVALRNASEPSRQVSETTQIRINFQTSSLTT